VSVPGQHKDAAETDVADNLERLADLLGVYTDTEDAVETIVRAASEIVSLRAALSAAEARLADTERENERLRERDVAEMQARHAVIEHRDEWKARAEVAEAHLADTERERDEAREAIALLIPWVANSGRGAAQEALAIGCDIIGSNPYDWTAHPDVLASRIELLGWPDRRKPAAGGVQTKDGDA
jgi:hypothetical protein